MPKRNQYVLNPKVDSHRNGVSGVGFHTILFDMPEGNKRTPMLGFVFRQQDGEERCYGVLATDRLAEGDVRWITNSWRGDHFIKELDEAIAKWEEAGRPRYTNKGERSILVGQVKKFRVTKISAVLYPTPLGFRGTVLVHRKGLKYENSRLYGNDRNLTSSTVNRLFGLIKVAKKFNVYPNIGGGMPYTCLEIEA